jgi:hypothetical protein
MKFPKGKVIMDLLSMARGSVPRSLFPDVERSFLVPQWGPHHTEGLFLRDHLERVAEALFDAAEGKFSPQIPDRTASLLKEASQRFVGEAWSHVFLHDLEKMNCLTLAYQDGRRESLTWMQWLAKGRTTEDGRAAIQGDAQALRRFCQALELDHISYFQQGKRFVTHGRRAAARLRRMQGSSNVLVRTVETHEIAYQFSGGTNRVNIRLFRRFFGDWSEQDVSFALLVNYADQMGSWGVDGTPVLDHFLNMACSADAYYGR